MVPEKQHPTAASFELVEAADGDRSPETAWREFCASLGELGGLSAVAGSAGLEHLIDQTSLWLAWEVLHADPGRPWFHRHNDMVSQWGGPNYDNAYRHARISPNHRYRIRGKMHGCDNFILAIRAGFMHEPVWGTLNQITANDLGIGRGDEFELELGPGGDGSPVIDLPDGAVMVSIREFYIDWQPEEPATIVIECLDPDPAAVASGPSSAELEARLQATEAQIRHSLTYWDNYLNTNRAQRTDNQFARETVDVEGKGLAQARYEFCFWNLAPDEALIVTSDLPAADYWSANLYRMATFEPIEWFGAITSRNHLQSHTDPDGKVRWVVSATDPGHPNWLDTTGLAEGLCTIRWFWPTDDTRPTLTTDVVPASAINSDPPVSAEQRAAELRSRQDHLRWRFRS